MNKQKGSSPNTRIDYYDTLRVVGMLSVIWIHIATPVVKMSFKKNMDAFITGDVQTAAVRFAVMIFLMVAGAAMLGRDYDYRSFVTKRLRRIYLPFLFITLCTLVFQYYMNRPKPVVHSLGELASWIGSRYMDCGLSQHFWYVYLLLLLYPLIPIAGRLIRRITQEGRRWVWIDLFLAVWMLLCALLHSPDVSPFTGLRFPSIEESMSGFLCGKVVSYLRYFPYMILGYRLSKAVEGLGHRETRVMRLIALSVLILTTALCAWRVYADTFPEGKAVRLDLGFQTYYHINTIAQTIAVFLLFANTRLGEEEKAYEANATGKRRLSVRGMVAKARDVLARDSYGIYLVHIMVISTLWHFRIYWAIGNPIWSVPLLTASVTVLSLLVVRILSSVPRIGKYLIGS